MPVLDRLAAAARIAEIPIFLAGGTVRDLCLGRPPRDVDVLVLGDAVGLARATARDTDLRASVHPRFGTARLTDPGTGAAVDLASARAETYSRPGSLPEVRPAGLDADLDRRDFTINAMALPVGGKGAGKLIDPHGGRRDLDRRLVRVLHPRSFRDDPSRAYRAVRLATRLGFRLEKRTARWLREMVAHRAVDGLSAARIAAELARAAVEPNLDALLGRLARWGLLAAIHPGLAPSWGAGARRRLARLLRGRGGAERLLALIAFLLLDASPARIAGALRRIELPAGARRRLPALLARARALAGAGDIEGPPLPSGETLACLVAEACSPHAGRRRRLARRRWSKV